MSTASDGLDEEKSCGEEDDDQINIGLYIGERNINKERHGRGWAILPNGDQYDGSYRKGKRHGIGLYVFKNGSRYFGDYRCGIKSGRGIFVYPDGSYYEGNWRKNVKHGKGRYSYTNGDMYSGNWYRGLRHGIGTYTFKSISSNSACGYVSFYGTWRNGVRVGPFQLSFGTEDKNTTLHGTWDYLYPQGPCVFSFNNRYLLMGYFETPGREKWLNLPSKRSQTQDEFTEENTALEEEDRDDVWSGEPSLWYAQEMCTYDVSLLPQEPVPLPLSDSEISVCSLSTVPTAASIKEPSPKYPGDEGEAEVEPEGGEEECCIYECSSSGIDSSSHICSPHGNPCAIEITDAQNC